MPARTRSRAGGFPPRRSKRIYERNMRIYKQLLADAEGNEPSEGGGSKEDITAHLQTLSHGVSLEEIRKVKKQLRKHVTENNLAMAGVSTEKIADVSTEAGLDGPRLPAKGCTQGNESTGTVQESKSTRCREEHNASPHPSPEVQNAPPHPSPEVQNDTSVAEKAVESTPGGAADVSCADGMPAGGSVSGAECSVMFSPVFSPVPALPPRSTHPMVPPPSYCYRYNVKEMWDRRMELASANPAGLVTPPRLVEPPAQVDASLTAESHCVGGASVVTHSPDPTDVSAAVTDASSSPTPASEPSTSLSVASNDSTMSVSAEKRVPETASLGRPSSPQQDVALWSDRVSDPFSPEECARSESRQSPVRAQAEPLHMHPALRTLQRDMGALTEDSQTPTISAQTVQRIARSKMAHLYTPAAVSHAVGPLGSMQGWTPRASPARHHRHPMGLRRSSMHGTPGDVRGSIVMDSPDGTSPPPAPPSPDSPFCEPCEELNKHGRSVSPTSPYRSGVLRPQLLSSSPPSGFERGIAAVECDREGVEEEESSVGKVAGALRAAMKYGVFLVLCWLLTLIICVVVRGDKVNMQTTDLAEWYASTGGVVDTNDDVWVVSKRVAEAVRSDLSDAVDPLVASDILESVDAVRDDLGDVVRRANHGWMQGARLANAVWRWMVLGFNGESDAIDLEPIGIANSTDSSEPVVWFDAGKLTITNRPVPAKETRVSLLQEPFVLTAELVQMPASDGQEPSNNNGQERAGNSGSADENDPGGQLKGEEVHGGVVYQNANAAAQLNRTDDVGQSVVTLPSLPVALLGVYHAKVEGLATEMKHLWSKVAPVLTAWSTGEEDAAQQQNISATLLGNEGIDISMPLEVAQPATPGAGSGSEGPVEVPTVNPSEHTSHDGTHATTGESLGAGTQNSHQLDDEVWEALSVMTVQWGMVLVRLAGVLWKLAVAVLKTMAWTFHYVVIDGM